jgi:hypothetical protein
MPPAFVLLPSPLLGPSVWEPAARSLRAAGSAAVVCPAPRRVVTTHDVLRVLTSALPVASDVVLVAHSNAGAYVPALVTQGLVRGVVFVDAVLPASRGTLHLAPGALLDLLRARADPAGLLPVWTQWWEEADVAPLFPDAATRERVEREQQRLPLSYFEETMDVPPGWDDVDAAYLAFGDGYVDEVADARRRGWRVTTLPGRHLHMLVDPDRVAAEIVALAGHMRR